MNSPQQFCQNRFRFVGKSGFKFACLCLIVWIAGTGGSLAQYLHVAQEGSSAKSVIAYLMVRGEQKHITAVQCSPNTAQTLFSKTITNDVVLPPVCVSNAIVVVSVDGTITKYGLDGAQLFSHKVLKAEEVSRLVGTWNNGIVYLTAMSYDPQRNPRYRMLWVEVSGSRPVVKGDAAIGEPKKVFRLENDLVVCGTDNTDRIPAPAEVTR